MRPPSWEEGRVAMPPLHIFVFQEFLSMQDITTGRPSPFPEVIPTDPVPAEFQEPSCLPGGFKRHGMEIPRFVGHGRPSTKDGLC